MSQDQTMTGTVKWFNTEKGYGFIKPDNANASERDVFVHISALQAAGLKSLADNQKVSFSLQNERGKTSAVELKLL